MPLLQKKDTPTATATGRTDAPAPAMGAAPLVEQVQRANYKDGAALLQPANANGYAGAKLAAKPKLAKVAGVEPSKEMLAHANKADLGHGAYAQTWAGGSAENEFKPKLVREREKDGTIGKTKAEIASGSATAGLGARVGMGGEAKAKGKLGEAAIAGDIHAGAEAAAKGKYKIGSDGAEVSGHAAAQTGIAASGSADATSAAVFGQTAGIGAKARGFAGARIGAGGKVAITKEFVGAKGQIGGFAGAEASGEVHGHVGPVAGKVTAAAQAGIGASLDGEISYNHGKLTLSAHAAVALGVGTSLGGSVELDIGDALKMGGAIAAAAARASAAHVAQVAATLGSGWAAVAHWFGL